MCCRIMLKLFSSSVWENRDLWKIQFPVTLGLQATYEVEGGSIVLSIKADSLAKMCTSKEDPNPYTWK